MATRNSGIRERSAPKRRKGTTTGPNGVKEFTQEHKKKELKTGIRILVEDLRVGDHIVTSWHTRSEANQKSGKRAQTIDELMDVTGDATRYVNRSVEVKKFEECPSQWRTHVHVNKGDCYDMRQYVWIVDE